MAGLLSFSHSFAPVRAGFACDASGSSRTDTIRRRYEPRPVRRARRLRAPAVNAGFDYQIGGNYPLPAGVTVVSRDWFSGGAADDPAYSICYVNAFQTQADKAGVDRRDQRSNWPRRLVLSQLGDDPRWGGEYLVDISSAKLRRLAAHWVRPMVETCARNGFEAVEYDNLDSWTRFDGTPLAKRVPFGKRQALAYARRLRAWPTPSTWR